MGDILRMQIFHALSDLFCPVEKFEKLNVNFALNDVVKALLAYFHHYAIVVDVNATEEISKLSVAIQFSC